MNPDLIKQYVLTAIRWAAIFGLGPLLAKLQTKYGVGSDELVTVITAVVTVAMFIWSLANKTHYETKVNTALDLPKGTGKDTLKEIIANGDGTSPTATK
jgi:hypothetical protein